MLGDGKLRQGALADEGTMLCKVGIKLRIESHAAVPPLYKSPVSLNMDVLLTRATERLFFDKHCNTMSTVATSGDR